MTDPIRRLSSARIPTAHGELLMLCYDTDPESRMPHLVLAHPDYAAEDISTLRIHSECITGDLWGSTRCDCGEQLQKALQIIHERRGLIVYLRQEGRGIGIINKLKAYQLQDQGLDTIDANVHMGFVPDARDYAAAIEILVDLGISDIHLLTNNPEKLDAFRDGPVRLHSRIPLAIPAGPDNEEYLRTKRDHMGHMIDIDPA